MPQLSSSDCERLLSLTGELHSIRDASSLPQHLLRALRLLIPYEFGGCHLIEPFRRHIAACYDPERSCLPAQHKDFWRLAKSHPLHPVLFANPARAWKLSDVISRQAFHGTEFYNVLYRPLGVDCELVAVLPDHQAPTAFLLISLHRCRTDFSERDRLVLNLLLPQVAIVRRRIRDAAEAAGRMEESARVLDEESGFQDWLGEHTPWALTQRECQVLFWLCQGKTNAEIGRILGIAERTAETHALHIYPKMGVENRYNAIATLNRLVTVPAREHA